MKKMIAGAVAVVALSACSSLDLTHHGGTTVTMNHVNADGSTRAAGIVELTETTGGLLFTPIMTGLSAGIHGFHVHTNASCAPGPDAQGKTIAAGAAGGHYDPQNTGKHGPPQGPGHLGDLPPLHTEADGRSTRPVLAPRLKLSDVRGRALMVHAGGDNHSDHPAPLGGGAGRVACGVIN